MPRASGNQADPHCFANALTLNFFKFLIKCFRSYPMNIFKCFVLVLAAFILACSRSSPNVNTKITTTTAPANTVVVTSGNSVDATTGDSVIAKQHAQSAETAKDDGDVADLYTEKCMICHKDTGKGGKVTMRGKTLDPADLTS